MPTGMPTCPGGPFSPLAHTVLTPCGMVKEADSIGRAYRPMVTRARESFGRARKRYFCSTSGLAVVHWWCTGGAPVEHGGARWCTGGSTVVPGGALVVHGGAPVEHGGARWCTGGSTVVHRWSTVVHRWQHGGARWCTGSSTVVHR